MPLESAIVPAAVTSSCLANCAIRIYQLQATVCLRQTGRPREGVRRPAKALMRKSLRGQRLPANEKAKQYILCFVHF